MFAPVPQKNILSNINIQFGPKITQQNPPICLDLIFDIFSQKNQSDRFVLQVLLGNTISDNTFLVELISKKGNGSDLADKIMTFLKSNQTYIKHNNQGKVQIKALGKGQICYLFINSQKFSQPFQNIAKACTQLSFQKLQEPNVNHEIQLKVKSDNGCQYIRKLLDNQGGMRAAFDSLVLHFTFQKTRLVQKVLQKIFIQLDLPTILGPLKGFNNLNLSLNFASASEFDKYQNLKIFGKVVNRIETFLFTPIKGEIKDEIKFTYFNSVFSFSGKVVAQEFQTLLEALFEEPNKDQ